MMKIASLHFGSGGGHIFGGLTIWQSFKLELGNLFHFYLLTDSEIQLPFSDESLEVLYLIPEPDKFFVRDRDTMLYQYLKHIDPDILIVDNIWFPLRPILHEFNAVKALFFWYLPPLWFNPPPLNDGTVHKFEADEYDIVFTIDPNFFLEGCVEIPPVINVPESRLKPPEIIRSVLEVPDDRKLALIAHNGHQGEIDEILRQAEIDSNEYSLRSISSFDIVSEKLFPLSHYMSGIDLAIGGCGYHFFYETKFFKIPTLYYPQPRIGNEQHWRLEHNCDYNGPYNGAELLVKRVLSFV